MSYKFTGNITHIYDAKEGESAKGAWANRKIVIEEANPQNPSYPQIFVGSLFKSGEHIKYATTDFNYKIGQLVEVEFNLKGNEYNNNHYGDLSIWKITAFNDEVKVNTYEDGVATNPASSDDTDDLPF
jgi:hypothetical protein